MNLGVCILLGLNGTLVEAKMFAFTLECRDFIINKCLIWTPTVQMPNLALTESDYIADRVIGTK